MDSTFTASTIFTISHIFGVALGAGGAFASDFLFFSSIKDRRISKTEARMLRVTSRMVWLGLLILFLSGIGLAWFKPEVLQSGKFWAKMTVVFFITINGLIFHLKHMPMLSQSYFKEFSVFRELVRNRVWLIIGGAVSIISWIYAIILGVLRNVSLRYSDFMALYILIVLSTIFLTVLFRERIIPKK